MSDSKLDLLKKLRSLASSSNPHEAKSAEEKLNALLKKYNIDESEINEDEIKDHIYYFKNRYERRLLNQVIYSVMGKKFTSTVFVPSKSKGKNIRCWVRCTESQALEIQVKYDFYIELLYEDIDFMITAFINKHNIFPPNKDDQLPTDDDEEFDLNRSLRLGNMMNGLQDKSFIHRIGD